MDPDAHLLRAARPVLTDLADHMRGTGFSLLLADRDARIVARWFSEPRIGRALDGVLAVPGLSYGEEVAGTNALSTAFEIGSGITVSRGEHYLESLRDFSCYAHPVIHPVTRTLEGVLDVTGTDERSGQLMMPLVRRTIREIEQRLSAGGSGDQARMLAALRARASRTRHAVLALSQDLTLSNETADRSLDQDLRRLLRDALDESAPRATEFEAHDGDGRTFTVLTSPIEGTAGAMLFEVIGQDPDPRRPRIPRGANALSDSSARLERLRRTRSAVLIAGEDGTGRSHHVRLLAAGADVRRLQCHELDLSTLAAALTEAPGSGTLVWLDGIETLPESDTGHVASALEQAQAWFVLTSTQHDGLSPAHQALAARCPERIDLAPLRYRRTEIGSLARAALERAGHRKDLTAHALSLLERHTWPGNLHELEVVMASAAATARTSTIQDQDLPSRLRSATRRKLSPLEQAERDAIVACLERHRGNKAHAAAELKIARGTLYRRLQALGIDTRDVR